MRKIFLSIFLFIIFLLVLTIATLSTIGFETDKFNNIIISKIQQTNQNVDLDIKKIKFKLDIQKLGLYLETIKPTIGYKKVDIPIKDIKVYIDFISILKSEIRIKKIIFNLDEFNLNQLKKLSLSYFKPSNITSLLNNKVKEGIFKTEIEAYLDKENNLDNFIAKGSVSNFKLEIKNNLQFANSSFDFFADKSDILLKNIFGDIGPIKISEGDVKAIFSKEISIVSNFKSKINYNKNNDNYIGFDIDFKNTKNLESFIAELNNSFSINFDKTYKLLNYKFKNTGKITKAKFNFENPLENLFNNEKINFISLSNSEIKTDLNKKKNILSLFGKYSINGGNFLSFDLKNIFSKNLSNVKLNAEYDRNFEFDLINYRKQKESVANISVDFEKQNENYKIKNIDIIESNNSISAEEIKIDKNRLISFKNFKARTIDENGNTNNNFNISFGKKILIKGENFDGINLPKFLNKKQNKNNFSHLNKDIEIDFKNINAPLSEKLKNFKLIGKIEKGKFSKIIAKGDFGSNNFLDISLKKDPNSQKKFLEIYSDLPKPLLTEYNFFRGLSGGKLLFTSVMDGEKSFSKLKIEKFNVINAPNMVKLLSLADLSGLADLAEGDGISFDILEIDMEKNKDSLKINEIIALGPSISVLMDGYQNPKVVSLRGTLVPAKTLNIIISKIPVIGNIVIPKEAGEGLFGISFKMKGPPNNIKTTINPIRTVTPRFIQKIIDKNKSNNLD